MNITNRHKNTSYHELNHFIEQYCGILFREYVAYDLLRIKA